MTSSSSPKLPFWVFVAAYVVLFAAAALIVANNTRPYSETVTISVVACVLGGAIVLLVPILARYERQKNEMLDDRQRALESLARTVASSAEQISIAANGLHEIADIAQKNLRHADQLPHKLQEKIAEFQAQLANANDAEKEELEKELEELRSSESERLQSVSDKVARMTTEFVKLEAAMQGHVTAANDALAKLSFGTASAIGKAQAAAEQALAQARQEAARTIGEAAGTGVKSLEAAKAAALHALASQFDANLARLGAATAELAATIERFKPAAATFDTRTAPDAPPASPETLPAPAGHGAAATEQTVADVGAPAAGPMAAPPKRPRKPRREEPAAPAVEPIPSPTGTDTTSPFAPASGVKEPEAAAPAVTGSDEPAPVPAAGIAEVMPAAPKTAEPFPIESPTGDADPAAAEGAKPGRKRSRREDPDQAGLGLSIEDDGQENGNRPGTVERVLSSDGATRLVVTAYIGIGNRLFVRGSGPGLSWDKGVPLQFVSIGKWRWETNDASSPFQLKILKNDEQECAGLGEITIEPGHQQEVTATFS